MTSPPPVPDTIGQVLDPAWLTAALGLRFPGIAVTRVTPGPVVERLSTNARFTIECAGGVPDGLVPTLCVKGYFGEKGRPMAHIGEPEARFYATLAASTGVHTLRSVYADVDPGTHHGVVITEDVVAAGGEFLDALSPYTPEQAALSLTELARLHANTWGSRAPAAEPWLTSRISSYFEYRGVDDIQANFDGPVGADVAPAARDAPRLANALRTLAARTESPGWAVIHGDAHVGNLFLDADGGAPGSSTGSSCSTATGASTSATTSRLRSRPPTANAASVTCSRTISSRCARRASTLPSGTTVGRLPRRHRVRVLHVGDHARGEAGDHPGAPAATERGCGGTRFVRVPRRVNTRS